MALHSIAKVAVEGTNLDFDSLYDYLIPDFLEEQIKIGYRVLVPFGRGVKKRQGFVFEIIKKELDADAAKYKAIAALCDREPLFTEKGIALARFVSERTFCTLFEAARAMLPAGLCMDGVASYCLCSGVKPEDCEEAASPEEMSVLRYLQEKGVYVSEASIRRRIQGSFPDSLFRNMEKKGWILSNWMSNSRLGGKVQRVAVLLCDPQQPPLSSLTEKQKKVLQALCETGSATVSELCYYTGVTASVVFALESKGLIALQEESFYRRPSSSWQDEGEKTPIVLSEEQEKAFAALKQDLSSASPACSLLFGVTGSGKTRVYMRLIDEAAEMGLSVILMVPEISLTPQTLSLFYARYGKQIAVFHSGLSAGERADEWRRVRSGEASIAVGTRSAVFAPFDRVGLIIVDEEQEHTYKSERSPRYHAVDVAKYRISQDNGLLLLGSATPSVETYAQAKAGRFRLLQLKERYGGMGLPRVRIVDVSDVESFCSVSPELEDCLRKNLEKGEQSILFMNRRGYHTFVSCSSCKKVVSCPNCSISLSYHKANHRLMCHYCGYSTDMITVCPECGGETVRYSGCGTQRIEDEIAELFPQARILRMDADTTMAKNAHEVKLRDFAQGKYDIMIGTQMVAKGLDFPGVSLVGVISADMGLYKDDYKSTERAFDLLTQVIGRAGRRREQGLALIQSMAPDSEVIRFAAGQDYENFYESEIDNRKVMIYPPFCDICVIGFVSEKEPEAKAGAACFLSLLQQACRDSYADLKLIVIGPNPFFIKKVGSRYRYKLLVKCRNTKRFRELVRLLLKQFHQDKRFRAVSVFADINPENMV